MHTLAENGKEVFYTGEYATDLLSEKAVDWLENRNNEKPFFLYMPYTKFAHMIYRTVAMAFEKYRESGDFSHLGIRCEIKNMNSMRFIQQAIDYEARRQIAILEDGSWLLAHLGDSAHLQNYHRAALLPEPAGFLVTLAGNVRSLASVNRVITEGSRRASRNCASRAL